MLCYLRHGGLGLATRACRSVKSARSTVPHDDSGLRQIFPGLYHARVAAALDE